MPGPEAQDTVDPCTAGQAACADMKKDCQSGNIDICHRTQGANQNHPAASQPACYRCLCTCTQESGASSTLQCCSDNYRPNPASETVRPDKTLEGRRPTDTASCCVAHPAPKQSSAAADIQPCTRDTHAQGACMAVHRNSTQMCTRGTHANTHTCMLAKEGLRTPTGRTD